LGEQRPGDEEEDEDEAPNRVTTSELDEGKAPRSRAGAAYDLAAITHQRELKTRRKAGEWRERQRGLRPSEGEETLAARRRYKKGEEISLGM
jgi:hypothetical protein